MLRQNFSLIIDIIFKIESHSRHLYFWKSFLPVCSTGGFGNAFPNVLAHAIAMCEKHFEHKNQKVGVAAPALSLNCVISNTVRQLCSLIDSFVVYNSTFDVWPALQFRLVPAILCRTTYKLGLNFFSLVLGNLHEVTYVS